MTSKDMKFDSLPVGKLAILVHPSCENLGNLIDLLKQYFHTARADSAHTARHKACRIAHRNACARFSVVHAEISFICHTNLF